MMDTDCTEAEDESPKRNAEVILKMANITELLLQPHYSQKITFLLKSAL